MAVELQLLPSNVALSTPFAPKPILRPNVTDVKCIQGLVNAFSGVQCLNYSFNAMQELRSPPAGVEVLERC